MTIAPILSRIIILLVSSLAIWESVLRIPRLFGIAWICVAVLLWLLVRVAVKKRRGKKEILALYIPLFFFMNACAFFLLLQDSFWAKQSIIALFAIGVAGYGGTLFTHAYFPLLTSWGAVQRVVWYLYIVTIFLTSVSLLALGVLLHIALWLQLLLFLVVSGMLSAHAHWLNDHTYKEPRVQLYFLTLLLFFGEMFWVMHFLPLAFFVAGLILTFFWYILMLATLSALRLRSFDIRLFLRGHLQLLFVLLIVALLTAQWS